MSSTLSLCFGLFLCITTVFSAAAPSLKELSAGNIDDSLVAEAVAIFDPQSYIEPLDPSLIIPENETTIFSRGDDITSLSRRRVDDCWSFVLGETEQEKLNYFSDFLNVQRIFRTAANDWIVVRAGTGWRYAWGTVRIHIRNQSNCRDHGFHVNTIAAWMNQIWQCPSEAQGWGYYMNDLNQGYYNGELIQIVFRYPRNEPGYTASCE